MKFLRTASTRRLLAVMSGLVLAIAIGSAIAVAATSGGPKPPPEPLANAVHQAVAAPAVNGITARIKFTNGLISSSNIQGSDPILTGASGRLWLTSDHQLRLELQASGDGNSGEDAQVVVTKTSWWIYDPMTNTKYQGTIPAQSGSEPATHQDTPPSVAQIQTQINQALTHLNVGGPTPSNIAGQEAYTVRITPKHDGGLLGAVALGWDALRGVPLRFGLYARGSNAPVLELTATKIHYGPIKASDLQAHAPAGAQLVTVQTPPRTPPSGSAKQKHPDVTGANAVQQHLSFKLAHPGTLVGLPQQSVQLLDWAGTPAALVSYGQGLGGIAVIEQPASSASAAAAGKASAGKAGSGKAGSSGHGLSLPTVSINGTSAQELATPIGTVLRFTRGSVAYTVIGSVEPVAAEQAARALVG
jgi:outer membrane lipoprotein-sorting protein